MKKDAINDYVVMGKHRSHQPGPDWHQSFRPLQAALFPPAAKSSSRCASADAIRAPTFDLTISTRSSRDRIREADEFYSTVIPRNLSGDAKNVMRQSFAGMLWSKQFYHYVVRDWLHGDPSGPTPPRDAPAGPQPRLAAPL